MSALTELLQIQARARTARGITYVRRGPLTEAVFGHAMGCKKIVRLALSKGDNGWPGLGMSEEPCSVKEARSAFQDRRARMSTVGSGSFSFHLAYPWGQGEESYVLAMMEPG